METIAELSGDVDAVVDVLTRDLSSPYQFVRIAERLEKASRHEDVLAWAERGVAAFSPGANVRLLEILAHEYHRRERHHDAAALAWKAFTDRPGLSAYERLHAHATRAGSWNEYRQKALEHLRGHLVRRRSQAGPRTRWSPPLDHSDLVQVFLWEQDVDAAWAEAVAGGCSAAVWMQLAEQREGDHPADVVPVYQAEIERVIDQRNNRAYEEAVELMKRVRKAMRRAGLRDEFLAYAASVRAAHKPKRNLMKLLDQEGW